MINIQTSLDMTSLRSYVPAHIKCSGRLKYFFCLKSNSIVSSTSSSTPPFHEVLLLSNRNIHEALSEVHLYFLMFLSCLCANQSAVIFLTSMKKKKDYQSLELLQGATLRSTEVSNQFYCNMIWVLQGIMFPSWQLCDQVEWGNLETFNQYELQHTVSLKDLHQVL